MQMGMVERESDEEGEIDDEEELVEKEAETNENEVQQVIDDKLQKIS